MVFIPGSGKISRHCRPSGAPKEAVAFYIDVLTKPRQTPEWKKYVKDNSMFPQFLTGEKFGAWLTAKEASFTALAKKLNLKLKKKREFNL